MHINYWINPTFDPTILQSSWILKEFHYYISDDNTHDSLFVQHVLSLHWDYLKAKGCYPKHHVIWSDGCSTQFKCARTWYFIVQYPQLTICDEKLEGVATLALGSQPRQRLARLQAKREAREWREVWRNEPSHSQGSFHLGSWSPSGLPNF